MQLFSVENILNIIPVSRRCIQKWAKDGTIPGARKIGGVWLFDLNKVNRWLRDSEIKPNETKGDDECQEMGYTDASQEVLGAVGRMQS